MKRLSLRDRGVFLAPFFVFILLLVVRPLLAEDIHTIEMHFYDANGSKFWSQAVSGVASADKLLLAPGEAVTVKLLPMQNMTGKIGTFKQPTCVVYALNITDGDPELLREGRSSLIPDDLPPLQPVAWQPLATTTSNDTVTATTTALRPGVYRMRLAAAEGAGGGATDHSQTIKPSSGPGLRGDFYVVIPDSPDSMDIYTEQNRHVYYRGETIPATVLLRSTATMPEGDASISLFQGRGDEPIQRRNMKLPGVAAANKRVPISIETRDLAPGQYALTVEHDNMAASWPFEVVDPVNPSPVGVSENELGGNPFADPILGSAFGWPGPDSLASGIVKPYADLQVTTFRSEMLTGDSAMTNQKLADTLEAVHAGPAAERIGVYDLRQKWMDGMARLRMGFWEGVQGRGLSFTKANTLPGTDDALRQTELNVARDYQAWANFFGPQVDVDCGVVPGARQLAYAGIPDNLTKAFQDRMVKAQTAALNAEHPGAIAAAGKDPAAITTLWGEWYRSVWDKCDTKDKSALASFDPTMLRTANREYHHATISAGQYPPDLYRGMDVHNVEAWGDPDDFVMFPDSWANLAVASRRVEQRPDQPVWIESQAYFHDTTGYMQQRWWGVLANGADGVGYAANVFGLRGFSGIDPHRPNFRRQSAAAVTDEVRTLGPVLRVLERDRRVAILLSKTEAYNRGGADYWYIVHCLGSYPLYSTYMVLTVAGYQPDFILDEQIERGDLDRYQVLYLTYQQFDMAPAVKAAVDRFVAHGGKVVLDKSCDAKRYPAAVKLDVDPFGFRATIEAGFGWAWVDQTLPKLRAVLDPLVQALPGRVEHPRCVTYWFHSPTSPDCRYVMVINEGYAPIETTLKLAEPMAGYDLMTGRRIDRTTSIPVDLRNTFARIYAFIPGAGAVRSLAVKASTKATAGDGIAMTAELVDESDKPIAAVAPASFRVADAQGNTCWERWTPIGPGTPPAVWEIAATQPPGKYTATITELLSGKTATFPITLRAGHPGPIISPSPTLSLTEAIDRRALGNLWNTQGAEWSVVVKSDQAQFAALADELVDALRRRGLKAQVWNNPPTIPMPVGFTFTPEQQAQRDRVFAGGAIGDRHYINPEAPYAPTWEPRTGLAICRNVVMFEPGKDRAIRVGVREFSGNHDAVYFDGKDEAELSGVVHEALALRPGDENIGPDAGRRSLAAGEMIGHASSPAIPSTPPDAIKQPKPVSAEMSGQPITWAERVGRPISKIDISPNGQNILATHDGLFIVAGQFTADGKPVRTIVRQGKGDSGDDIRGIDDTGSIAVETELFKEHPLALDGQMGGELPEPIWKSPDGQQSLHYESYTAQEKDAQGKLQPVARKKLVRRRGNDTVYSSEELGNLPGTLVPSPDGNFILQPDDGQTRDIHLTLRFVTMRDGSGKITWQKKHWLIYPGVFNPSIAWSTDSKNVALVRNYPSLDYHGIWPDLNRRCTIDLVRASDGEVLAEGNPAEFVEKMVISADGSFAVGLPEFMADHYWLLEAGKGMTRVAATNHWLYDITLDAAGKQLFTFDIDGVLTRREFDGRVIWSKPLKVGGGPLLGILKPIRDDVLLGSTTGRLYRISGHDGRVLWQRASTDLLDGKMVGGL